MARMISGPITAPLARTTPNRIIVTPNSRKLHVARIWICWAIGSASLWPPRNSASAGRSATASTTTRTPVMIRFWTIPTRAIRLDPVPAVGADILRGHRARRGGQRHRRHLQVGPQLHRDAERRRGVDPFAVDEADRRQRRGRDDDHLQAHRETLADDHPEQLAIGLEIGQLRAAQPQRQVAPVDGRDQRDQARRNWRSPSPARCRRCRASAPGRGRG